MTLASMNAQTDRLREKISMINADLHFPIQVKFPFIYPLAIPDSVQDKIAQAMKKAAPKRTRRQQMGPAIKPEGRARTYCHDAMLRRIIAELRKPGPQNRIHVRLGIGEATMKRMLRDAFPRPRPDLPPVPANKSFHLQWSLDRRAENHKLEDVAQALGMSANRLAKLQSEGYTCPTTAKRAALNVNAKGAPASSKTTPSPRGSQRKETNRT